MSYPSYLTSFFLLFLTVIQFSACSNNLKHEFTADGYIVFDYTCNSVCPLEKMSVFITTEQKFPVVELKVYNEHNDNALISYEWTSKEVYVKDNVYWCQNLSVPVSAHIPVGKYTVTAVFSDGSEQTSAFSIQYPSYCISNDISHVSKLIYKDFNQLSEIYDNTKIKNVNSALEKICYINTDKHVLCILPESSIKGL